jgi:hypothetical protein
VGILPGQQTAIQAVNLVKSILAKFLAGDTGTCTRFTINQQGLVFKFLQFTDAFCYRANRNLRLAKRWVAIFISLKKTSASNTAKAITRYG